jgi:riboflavin synthase
MFTGIITDLGVIDSIEERGNGIRFWVRREKMGIEDEPVWIGESIAHNGACLTVVAVDGALHACDLLKETLDCTNLGDLGVGTLVNLERSLRMNAQLGGHIVQGHVDATGILEEIRETGDDYILRISAAPEILRHMIFKGSIALDGISLTIADLDEEAFEVCIIPHTWDVTNLHDYRAGNRVNLELDMVGKFISRLVEPYVDRLISVLKNMPEPSSGDTFGG